MTSPLTRKQRILPPFGQYLSWGKAEQRRRSDGVWVELFPKTDKAGPGYHGNQVTDSEGHPWPPKGGQGDMGGPFSTTKRYGTKRYIPFGVREEGPSLHPATDFYDRVRVTSLGQCSCPIETIGSGSTAQPKWPTAQGSSTSNLNALGATAASRCRPTAPEEDLSTALGEVFRDGLPSVIGSRTWESRTIRARNAGDEFLNIEFGWLPLVSDVERFGTATLDSNRIVQQYERDRGRLVRRSYYFPTSTTTTNTVLSTNKAPDGESPISSSRIPGLTTGGVWSKSDTTTISRWFKGAFSYGVPLRSTNVGSFASAAEIADRLYNASPLSPDVLYNLTPWSWALDWFTNTGDVLAYLSDVMSQGLVMQYGYFMEHTVHEVKYSLSGAFRYGRPVNVPDAKLVTETKTRTKANPFGFGITWDGLSPIQVAILTALGISRT
jgi:hypothetical protein